MENYGISSGQHQNQLKLNNLLINIFIDEILFLTKQNNSQQVIISRNSLAGQSV